MESALGAALSGAQKKPTYRRAVGAARESKDDPQPQRPPVDGITVLSKDKIAALATPILALVGEMQFYNVMGASTQVIVVDMDSTLSVAFIAATESRVSSVLLWDSQTNTFAGMLTVTDYIRILLHCHETGSSASDSIATQSIRALLQKELWIKDQDGGKPSSRFVWGTPNLSVLDCLTAMIQHRVNRLPILASKAFEEEVVPPGQQMGVVPNATSTVTPCPPPPPSFSVISVVTFPQLLAHIGRVLLTHGGVGDGAASEATLYDVPLKALGVGRHIHSIANGTIPRITRKHTVCDALSVMIDQNVHAVCIRDEEPSNAIVDVVTRSDVLRMESGGAYDVTLSLDEALAWRPAQAMPVVCSLNDCFGDVLSHFVNTWVKEMFVVDPDTDVVIGQLSMKELLQFLFDALLDPTATPAA